MSEEIFCRCTDCSAVLFWDKPEDAPALANYEVIIDGCMAASTDRTHWTVEGLEPETAHTYEIFLVNPLTNAECRKDSIGSSGNEADNSGSGQSCQAFSPNARLISWGQARQTASPDARLLGRGAFQTAASKERLDVTASPYFAKGDASTLNTALLQQAIDDCRPDQCVYFPAGIYLTGALRLHSDMELYLEEGAVLQGTADYKDYEPRIRSRFEGTERMCYSSLLNLGNLDRDGDYNCRNVVIRGRGTIASGGQPLALAIIEHEKELLRDYLASNQALVDTCENEQTIPGRVRPRLLQIANCQNIWISGLTLANGASWNVHMIYSDQIVTDHCIFRSEGVWNGDGWDPDSSTSCTLFASRFFTGDDAVAIKSGKNPEGNEINRPTKHIRVFDCHSAFGHGICIGSEMSGGVEDVRIWDCDLQNSLSGIELKGTKKRGGYIRDVSVRDCAAPRVMLHSVSYNDDGIPASEPPVFENCEFRSLTLTCRALNHSGEWIPVTPIEIAGFDEPGHEARDLVFRDIRIASAEPRNISLCACKGVSFLNVSCQ